MEIVILLLLFAAIRTSQAVYLMYLTGQHYVVPEKSLVINVTHVALAFMQSEIFNADQRPTEWPLFTTVGEVRPYFNEGTAIMIAIGGWGDTEGFSKAAATHDSRQRFAENVKAMVDDTGADGVDIDWEYPGGNGEDYKTVPNSQREWEINAYPKLISAVRESLGRKKFISAAVPGLPRDMIAFSKRNMPSIVESVDFLNIMTYDLMNRRDNITKHHTGITASKDAIEAYLLNGLPAPKANLGFAFYIKWFKTDPDGGCDINPVGCKTVLMEDPKTGVDLGQAGAFSWHDVVPAELLKSFNKAMEHGLYDSKHGGHYFWDSEEHIFWSWDTPEAITIKSQWILEEYDLGGVFAWGLGEDAPTWAHLEAVNRGVTAQNERSICLKRDYTPIATGNGPSKEVNWKAEDSKEEL